MFLSNSNILRPGKEFDVLRFPLCYFEFRTTNHLNDFDLWLIGDLLPEICKEKMLISNLYIMEYGFDVRLRKNDIIFVREIVSEGTLLILFALMKPIVLLMTLLRT